MDELQFEELQKSNQQVQDRSPYDPNAADHFPDGYTPVGSGEDHTPVEQVSPGRVPELEVPTPQLDDIIPQDLYGSSGDNVVFGNMEIPETNIPSVDSNIPSRNANYVPNDLPGTNIFPDNSNSDPVLPDSKEQNVDPSVPSVEPPLSPVDPPVELPVPPVDPPHPPEPPTPPEPPVEPPVPPVDPPHPPEPPTPPDPPVDPPVDPPTPPEDHKDHPNNGFGNGDQDAPGGSGPHNNAENDQTPGEQGNSHQNDNPNPPSDHGNDNPGPQDPPVDPPTNNQDHPNNGFGNGDQDAPGDSGPHNNAENDQTPGEQGNSHENDSGNGGNGGPPDNHQDNGWGNGDDAAPGGSGPHNNAENDQTPSGHYDDFVSRFIEENPVDHTQIVDHSHISYNWEQDNHDFLDYTDQHIPPESIPELPHIDNFDHHMDHPIDHSM
jgi:hypothetical protein